MTKNEISSTWPTIFELASTINYVDHNLLGRAGGGRKNANSVAMGLIPEPFPATEGYFVVSPAQLASLKVPKIEVGSDIKGFQRDKMNTHARRIARSLLDGIEVPPITVSIFPDGEAYIGDGQHRALGAIIAGKNLEVVVKRRTVEEARKLFAAQSKARKVKRDDTLLTGDSPIELYIQDALTSFDHPWSDLVAVSKSNTKMTPTTMATMLGSFVFNTFNQGVNYYTSKGEKDFDKKKADQLAKLVKSFGVRTTNPVAFRGVTLRAIANAATFVFQRNPNATTKDEERWMKHMPSFDFSKFPHILTKEAELTAALVTHWNKRLPEERRVLPYTFS